MFPLVEDFKSLLHTGTRYKIIEEKKEQEGVLMCIEQTHTVRFYVRVKNNNALQKWIEALRVAIFYDDGAVVDIEDHKEVYKFEASIKKEIVYPANEKLLASPKTNPPVQDTLVVGYEAFLKKDNKSYIICCNCYDRSKKEQYKKIDQIYEHEINEDDPLKCVACHSTLG